MLHSNLDGGYLLVSQPAHAWVSGQLAAAWGNERFGTIEPRSEVCLAAEQHDIGWLEWEASPTLNLETGLPRTFRELPTLEHVAVWAPAGPRALVYGPYVALLVSMHGTGLYRHHDFSRDTPEEVEAARAFIDCGGEFERSLLVQLKRDASYAPHANADAITRNRTLVAVWDAMSLALCGGITDERSFNSVPASDGAVTLTVTRIESHQDRLSVEPWPFREETLTLACSGRLLDATFSDETLMREALASAPWRRMTFELVQKL